ncbi:GAF domain-containing protein [Myceligenerans xiligouense]|uniref:Histidine kinase n=1 Tax=Myceligenerans xiligouense TaxID=253184 RepID=A0A3N4Z3G3_9MICO|nr:GAF domain-containing protein [Myceligenerans xiligouense]RPF20518.1 histidine kinase [Myceligenerans xiligouense]
MEHLFPRMQLDELLKELQSRLEAVLTARDGIHALLEAVVSIGRDLEIETVLRRIVEAAISLVDCRYGALGVIGDDGQLAQFIPVGLTEEEITRITEWPHGRGLLGLLIADPHTLRLENIRDAEESYGFPDGHPPMHSFLGVPIRVRDEVFGNLYLTEKNGGRQFDEQDELIITALATAAGVAIENARLYEETRRREEWLDASGKIARELLFGTPTADALRSFVARARHMVGGAVAVVAVPDAAGTTLEVEAADGDDLTGLRVPVADSLTGSVFTSGEPVVVNALQGAGQPSPLLDQLPGGPAVLIPLGAERVRGVVVVVKTPGTSPFTPGVIRMLQQFADQAALALELADTRRRAEQFGLEDDRARIARDLHDVVIQRLFANAMTLISVVRLVDQPDVARRVEQTVDDLDVTIRQIRSTVFALQTGTGANGDGLRSRIIEISQKSVAQLGYAPGVRFDGLVDTDVPPEVAEDAVAVVQEALANVVRHAHAKKVEVVVSAVGGELNLVVADDGVGIGEGSRRSGLANLTERARRWGGRCDVRAADEGGTVVEWVVGL